MKDEATETIWQSMVTDSRAKGEHNDCTVKALTAATGLPYADCHMALAKQGRKPRKGCHFNSMGKRAAASLGWLMETVDPFDYRAKTMITAERDRAFRSGRYVVQVSRHVAALIDGKVIDHSQGSRRRIQCVYAFTPIAGFEAPTVREAGPIPEGSETWRSYRKYTKKDNYILFD